MITINRKHLRIESISDDRYYFLKGNRCPQGSPRVYYTCNKYVIYFWGAQWIKRRECEPHHLVDELNQFIALHCDSNYTQAVLPGHDITQRVNYHKLLARAVQYCFDLIVYLEGEPCYSQGDVQKCMQTQRYYIKQGKM